ncbi:MAG: MaoC family dehydratase [Nitratireductor sp.]|nr:MaoC family dehydratase [Nitratireductor sp.]
MAFRYFEDFAEGEVIELGKREVSAEEIVEFASQFDPASFHLSEEGAKASILGRLSASGWHTCCILMRMMCDSFLLDSSGQGSPGIDECKWLAPVHAADTLTGRATTVGKRLSASRPGVGIIHMRFELFKDDGSPVMTLINPIMFRTRAGSAA